MIYGLDPVSCLYGTMTAQARMTDIDAAAKPAAAVKT